MPSSPPWECFKNKKKADIFVCFSGAAVGCCSSRSVWPGWCWTVFYSTFYHTRMQNVIQRAEISSLAVIHGVFDLFSSPDRSILVVDGSTWSHLLQKFLPASAGETLNLHYTRCFDFKLSHWGNYVLKMLINWKLFSIGVSAQMDSAKYIIYLFKKRPPPLKNRHSTLQSYKNTRRERTSWKGCAVNAQHL